MPHLQYTLIVVACIICMTGEVRMAVMSREYTKSFVNGHKGSFFFFFFFFFLFFLYLSFISFIVCFCVPRDKQETTVN